jgi:hypothetical protein
MDDAVWFTDKEKTFGLCDKCFTKISKKED